ELELYLRGSSRTSGKSGFPAAAAATNAASVASATAAATAGSNNNGDPAEAQQAAAAAAAAAAALSSLPAAKLARLAWAFASYNYFPPDEWVQAYWLAGIWVRGLPPEGATAVLWSLGVLQLPLEPLWGQHYFIATAGRLSEIPPEGLVNALWALAACREVDRTAATSSSSSSASSASLPLSSSSAAAAKEGGTEATTAATADGGADAGDEDADDGEYDKVSELIERQLRALLQLQQHGSEAQRHALTQLQAAVERRRRRQQQQEQQGSEHASRPRNSAGAGDATLDSLIPSAWLGEWYDATLPYLYDLDKVLVVKALWATAALGLAPPPPWLRLLAKAAAALAEAGAMEPLEMMYVSRSVDALLTVRKKMLKKKQDRKGKKATREGETLIAAAAAVAAEDEDGEEDQEQALMGELAEVAGECFRLLSQQQQLPPAWRRLNPRFPPYAQPKPKPAVAAGNMREGEGQQQ
ncbi:hypothetical protein Agub_g6716, partial [Astrephomene gubernaculifera]